MTGMRRLRFAGRGATAAAHFRLTQDCERCADDIVRKHL